MLSASRRARDWATAALLVLLAPGPARVGAQGTDAPGDVCITLERTACFGECPVYTVSIDGKGNVTYEGRAHVRVTGRQTDRIPATRVAALLETAERIGFFGLDDHYRSIRQPDGTEIHVTDQATTFVTVRRGGRSKRIEDYIGAPPALTAFERQIDAEARTVRWIRLDAGELRRLRQEGWSPSAAELAVHLTRAVLHDEVGVVRGLLEAGADANAGHLFGASSPLLTMVRSPEAARALLEAGANPMASDRGWTPLRSAALKAPEIAAALLDAGAIADQPSGEDGHTALWQAACAGNLGVVALLLRAGADPGAPSGASSPLECARLQRELARLRLPLGLDEPAFTPDFDGVIAALERARARPR